MQQELAGDDVDVDGDGDLEGSDVDGDGDLYGTDAEEWGESGDDEGEGDDGIQWGDDEGEGEVEGDDEGEVEDGIKWCEITPSKKRKHVTQNDEVKSLTKRYGRVSDFMSADTFDEVLNA